MIISQNRISFVDKKEETFNNNHCCGFFLSYIEFFFFSSKEKDRLKPKKKEKKDPSALKEREVPQHPSCLFFQYNTQLGPPYHILVDTNFINFSIKAKLDLVQSMMDCLYAKCEYQTFPFL